MIIAFEVDRGDWGEIDDALLSRCAVRDARHVIGNDLYVLTLRFASLSIELISKYRKSEKIVIVNEIVFPMASGKTQLIFKLSENKAKQGKQNNSL